MASSVSSFVNFRAFGSSGHVTSYADGSFLTVWTDFDASGAAYVYGKTFRADGTTLRDAYLIAHADNSAQLSFADVTATTLKDGRTIVSWASNGSAKTIQAAILTAGDHQPTGEVFQINPATVSDPSKPEIHAHANGGFSILYEGTFGGYANLINSVFHASGSDFVWSDDYNDAPFNSGSTADLAVLPNEQYLLALAVENNGSTTVGVAVWMPGSQSQTTYSLGTVSGLTGIRPAVEPLADGTFVAAWEDSGNVIRAQVFDATGIAVSAAVTFAKPGGAITDTPVIRQLADGYAIAFRVQEGADYNIYTAAARADGTIIANTTHVGTGTAGDQWDPSLVALSGNTYAVSWASDTDTGPPQLITEVIGIGGAPVVTPTNPPRPSKPTYPEQPSVPEQPSYPDSPAEPDTPTWTGPTWTGTGGDDAFSGTALSEMLNGAGGNDFITGGGGHDFIIGGSGVDYLSGGAGHDTIDGGAGNDSIYGGAGRDLLTGGTGRDAFAFNTKPNKKANLDKITDFSVRDDSIQLIGQYFSKLGKGSLIKPKQVKKGFFKISDKAKDKDDYVLYNKKTGMLLFDADGSGKAKAVELALLSKNLKMTYKDFFII